MATDTNRDTAPAMETTCSGGAMGRTSRKRLCDQDSDDMAPEVSKVISFQKQKGLLRASRLSAVMRRGAAILELGKEGSAQTYELSEEATGIDSFLSHNWVVARMWKFMCLVLHFNFAFAAAAAIAALGVMALLGWLGARPLEVETPVFVTDPGLGTMKHGWGCTLVMSPVFLLAAFCGSEVQRLFGYHGCRVFLDRTCIHQVDPALKRHGIQKLGAFLRASRCMLVLYTDVYLTKLWTAYELACFLSLRSSQDLIVVPTYQPVVVFGGVAILYVSALLRISLVIVGWPTLYANVGYGVGAIAMAVVFRIWARSKEAMRTRIANFRVQECSCFCEQDRPIVYQNIAVLMRVNSKVDRSAEEQACLDAFNRLVRKHVLQAMTASIGPLGMNYAHIVVITLCTQLPTFVDCFLMSVLARPEEWLTRFRICWGMSCLIFVFALFPLLTAMLSMWCGLCPSLRGFREKAFVGCGVLLVVVLGLILAVLDAWLLGAATWGGPQRNAYAVALPLLLIFGTAGAITLYTRGRSPRVATEASAEVDLAKAETPEPASLEDGEAAALAERATLERLDTEDVADFLERLDTAGMEFGNKIFGL